MTDSTHTRSYLAAAEQIAGTSEQGPAPKNQLRQAMLFALIDIAYTLRDIRSELRARPIG